MPSPIHSARLFPTVSCPSDPVQLSGPSRGHPGRRVSPLENSAAQASVSAVTDGGNETSSVHALGAAGGQWSALHDALEVLCCSPSLLRQSDGVVEEFSALWGSTREAQSHMLALEQVESADCRAWPGARNTSLPDGFSLAGVFRHWGLPPLSRVAVRHNMSVTAPCGSDGYRLGAASMLIAPGLGADIPSGTAHRGMWVRLYSGRADLSATGLWHGCLMDFAQDLYLKALVQKVPHHQPRNHNARVFTWPTLAGPSYMRLVHGAGIPVMEVNGERCAVGLKDVTENGFLSLENRLFVHSLVRLTRPFPAGWHAPDLNAVFTPILADWMLQMRAERAFLPDPADSGSQVNSADDANTNGLRLDEAGRAAHNGRNARQTMQDLLAPHTDELPPTFWDQWYRFVLRNSAQHSLPLAEIVPALQDEIRNMKRMSRTLCNDMTGEDWERSYPVLTGVIEGLCHLQDCIRYGGGHLCELPVAGLERVWLNGQLRNMICLHLGLHAPAEIAQFDLLLSARRERSNSGFNDHSVNLELMRHLEWVASGQAGFDSRLCHALAAWTNALGRSIRQNDDPLMFWLDEHSRATAHSWP